MNRRGSQFRKMSEMSLSCHRGAYLLQQGLAAEHELEGRGQKVCGRRKATREMGPLGSERRCRYLLPMRKLR